MKWLEAMLAFALTMVVFSTMVTVLLEIVYRAFHAREHIFKLMLERMFNQVLWPLVRERLGSMSMADVQRNFVDALIRNTAAADPNRPVRKWGVRRVDNAKLTVLEFAERLATTEVGKAIAAEGEARVIAIVNDLAQKYERFAQGARSFLAEWSAVFSVVLSIGLAFALNIDAVVVFRSFIQDAKLTAAVNERFGAFAQEMRAANASLERAQAGSGLDSAQNVEEIKKRLDEMRTQVTDLKEIGLPIGYENFPGCTRRNGAVPIDVGDCAKVPKDGKGAWSGIRYNASEQTPQFLFWMFCVTLGGLLIGLGAPFWFDLAQGLSKSLQVLKALSSGREKEKDEAAATAAAQGASPPPRNPVEAFTTAIAALPRSATRGRLPLMLDGTLTSRG